MQRVHIDDMTGFLLSQSDEWEVISFPAIADCDQTILTWDGHLYHRRLGEALSPEREPLDVLSDLKLQIGSDAFSAQYQQQPEPPGGAMVKRHWIKRYRELPPDSERSIVLQSWDTASKGGPENDWSVCTTWVWLRAMDGISQMSGEAALTIRRSSRQCRDLQGFGRRVVFLSKTPARAPRLFRS